MQIGMYPSENLPQRVPINNILADTPDTVMRAQSMGLNQTRPEYQRHQMILPEEERGGIGAFSGAPGAPNYMQYSAGGTYDDGKYSQYAASDYGGAAESPFPQRRNGPVFQPENDPNYSAGISGGRTPDTGRAIRPGSSGREMEGVNRAGQSAPSNQAFEVIESSPQPISRSSSNPPPIPPFTSYYTCPVCNETAIRVSDSPTRDAVCRNRHAWKLINGQKMGPSRAP